MDGGHSLGAGALAEALMPWFAEEIRKAKETGWMHRDTQAWGGIRPDNPYCKGEEG